MPTDWESHYREGNLPWDKGAPSPGLVDYLETHPIRGKVLAPGCGKGHDVRALAAAGAEVVGVDIAPTAVESARATLRVGSETYLLADLFDLPEAHRAAYDWVFEHTCFCAIDPSMRGPYVEAVVGALKAGGNLLAVFYLDPGHAIGTEGPPFETTLAELDGLFSDRFALLDQWPPAGTYPGRENREWMRLLRKR